MPEKISIARFKRAIQDLPSDKPQHRPDKWYETQKEHWLGWLKEYHGPGCYDRTGTKKRDAQFAYNHIVEPKMLLWLIAAASVPRRLVNAAIKAAAQEATMSGKSAAIRKHVPWEELASVLWKGN